MSTEWKMPSEQEAREAFWGCYPDTGDSTKCDLWMTAFRWCRAMLAASPQPAQAEPGNHHPWCMGCASDEFDWADERDADPEAALDENLKGAGRE